MPATLLQHGTCPADTAYHTAPPLPAGECPQPCFEQLLKESKGRPFVFNEGNVRSLHFEEKYIQSAMWVSAPTALALSYTRVMMNFRQFIASPRHILMIGLGGGSLAKYCYRHLPSARITVVEIDADVIALRDQFMIPPDNERFQVVQADGADFVATATPDVDVLLLDGFGAHGQPAELSSAGFYQKCRQLLTPDGMLVANLSRDGSHFWNLMTRLLAEFGDHMWQSDVPDSNNCVIFAGNSSRHATLPVAHAAQHQEAASG